MRSGDANTGSAETYDTIFIGSGIGTILCASLLAQFRNERVLILEKHFTPGGFTHTFKRKNRFFWDVGIHYIGDLQEGSILRKLFDLLSGKRLRWQKMPNVFEKFVYPDFDGKGAGYFTFPVYDDPERFVADLVKLFPAEEAAIRKYIDDIRKVNTWFGRHVSLRGRAPFIDHLEEAFAQKEGFNPRHSIGEYMDARIRDKRLKALLLSQWGNYGLPPAQASFIIHAAVAQHYFHGGYYPLGGSHRIFESIVPFLEKTGSSVKSSHEVTEILIENGRAIGVKAQALRGSDKSEQTFFAKKIISDAGAYNTYLRLLKKEPVPFAEKLETFYRKHPVVSNVTLYLGLSGDPRQLGFGGENHWIYSSYDHDANFRESANWVLTGKPAGAYLSFPSLKNAEAKDHTAEVIAFTDYEFFERWKQQPWRRRDEEYRRLKQKISEALLDYIEARYPGFRSLVEYCELSTPITTEHFASHPRGSIYGVACTPDRFVASEAPWCNPVSPFENLYLTGADVSSPGVAGAMMGAVATLSQLPNGFKLLDLMRL